MITGFMLFWSAIDVLFLGYAVIKCFQIKSSAVTRIISCFLLALSFAANQILLASHKGQLSFPLDTAPFINTVFTAASIVINLWLFRHRQNNITGVSVKEATDSLPTGICCSLPNGVPILVNDRMNAISTELTGMPIGDCNEFIGRLMNGSCGDAIQSGEKPVVRLKSGKVYSFTMNKIDLGGTVCRELIAADTTDLYLRIEKLREKKQRAEILNMRLKALSGTIEYITMSRELMTMKSALHDDLGRCLLLVKRYLCDPGNVDINDITQLWSISVRKLENESPEFWQTPYYVLERQADLLGIELTIIGDMPHEPKYTELINSVVSTHLLNVFEHAHGTAAKIVFGEENGYYTIRMTNDGELPRQDMTERGGLKSVKELTELFGGSTRLIVSPAFGYEIRLPKGDRNGLQSGDSRRL